MSHISLTIPSDDEKALVAGATMLLTLAGKIPEMELEDAKACDTKQERITEVAEHIHSPTTDEPEMFTKEETAEIKEFLANTETPRFTPPELDSAGLPWDARIHASSKARIADGTWRKKRGVDEADYLAVVEELKQLMAAPVVQTEETPTPAPPPPAEAQAVAPPPPPAADELVPDTFPAFLKAVTEKVQQGTLTLESVNAALPEGVANIQGLGTRLDLIPQVWDKLK